MQPWVPLRKDVPLASSGDAGRRVTLLHAATLRRVPTHWRPCSPLRPPTTRSGFSKPSTLAVVAPQILKNRHHATMTSEGFAVRCDEPMTLAGKLSPGPVKRCGASPGWLYEVKTTRLGTAVNMDRQRSASLKPATGRCLVGLGEDAKCKLYHTLYSIVKAELV